MKDFAGKIAVVTGGGTGMGRELARQLVAEGCSVAMCDVSARAMAETVRLIEADGAPQGTKVSTHVADVSLEAALIAFRDELAAEHQTDHIHLLFNNAGIGGGGSRIVLFPMPEDAVRPSGPIAPAPGAITDCRKTNCRSKTTFRCCLDD